MPRAMLIVRPLAPNVCLGTMTLPVQREFILNLPPRTVDEKLMP